MFLINSPGQLLGHNENIQSLWQDGEKPNNNYDYSFNEIESSNEGSPKLKKAPNFEIGTPSSSKNGGGLNSSTFHEESHNMVFNSSNSANIKPVILASKFDCFSDSD